MIPTEWATPPTSREADEYRIMDDEGIIHTGTEEEMNEAFQVMVDGDYSSNWYYHPWSGDLVLVQVIRISR